MKTILSFHFKKVFIGSLLLAGIYSNSFAQSNEELYTKGLKCKTEFKYDESLTIFQTLLKSDSNNVNYLANASISYSKSGFRLAAEDKKMEYYKTADYLAKKAVTADNNNAEAHYAYALALGRINENASSKQKIANAKLIKSEADMAIKLNPKHAGAYHILGRWHSTIAGFGMVEKVAINTLFGGVPQGGSYDASIEAFNNAIKYDPNYILHYYELANAYYQRNAGVNDLALASVMLKKALALPNLTPEDPDNKKKCEELLKKIG